MQKAQSAERRAKGKNKKAQGRKVPEIIPSWESLSRDSGRFGVGFDGTELGAIILSPDP